MLTRYTAGTVVPLAERMAGTRVLLATHTRREQWFSSFCRCSSRLTFEAAVPMKCFPEAETEPVIGRKMEGIAEVITTSKSLITQSTAEGPEVERLAHEWVGRVEHKQAKRLRDQAHAKVRGRAAIRERDATAAKWQANAHKARESDAAIDSREARRRAARKARKVEDRKLAAIDTDDEDLNSFLLDLSGMGGVQPA